MTYEERALADGAVLACEYFTRYDGTIDHTNTVTIYFDQHGVKAGDMAADKARRRAAEHHARVMGRPRTRSNR